jgi:hypothetical protein
MYPDGEVLHAAGVDNSGNFCWDSEEHLNNFINYRPCPVMQKINMPMPARNFSKYD